MKVYGSPEEMIRAAAADFAEVLRSAVEERGKATLVLSGGSTPGPLYTELGTTCRERIPWDSVHLFWGDERWVPLDDPASNYALAVQTLISRVPLPAGNVHPVPTGAGSPERAAELYEGEIREFLEADRSGSGPAFDLVHLGMGEDGHTASLFPGADSLDETERWVLPVTSPPYRPPHRRVTLTLPAINSSRTVCFVASGAGKRRVIDSILADPAGSARLYPAAMVRPYGGAIWYLDPGAAPVSLPE